MARPPDETHGVGDPVDPEFDRLLVDCIEALETDGPAVLDAACRDHPQWAAQLRSAVGLLHEHGFAGGASDVGAAPPRRLAEFELLHEVGRGGMGVVFAARDTALDRRVAVKVLLPHLTLDERTVARFRREGRTIAALRHPGIVQVHAIGHAHGHDYIAMEFVEGAPLDRVIAELRGKSVTSLRAADFRAASGRVGGGGGPDGDEDGAGFEALAIELIARLALALDHAHRAGVVHRDVKPSNILVREDGAPVLTDFGLARRDGLPGLTQSGAQAGTPAYMAPEQTRDHEAIDGRTDVFSLGATAYELLTLDRPFSGETSHEMMHSIRVEEPHDPRRANRRIGADLAAVVLRALEKDPRRRYASAADFAADLRAVVAQRPVTARRASRFERARRWVVRQPVRAALIGVLTLAIPTVTALVGFQVANRPLVAAAQQQERRDKVESALTQAYLLGFGSTRASAIAALDGALELEPDNAEAVAAKAFLLLQPPGVEVEPDVEGAGTALAYLEDHPALLARERPMQRIRAWCWLVLGRDREAQAELERLGEPQEALEAFWCGVREIQPRMTADLSAQRRQAQRYLQRAVFMADRARPGFHYYLAAAIGFTHDRGAAEDVCAALERLWPDSAYAWRGIGLAMFKLDPERAVRAYRRSLELESDFASRLNLANALGQAGRFDEAAAEYRGILAEQPEWAKAHYNLGQLLFARLGKPDEALVHFVAAVAADPDYVPARHYQIWISMRRGEHDAAAASARAGLERDPGNALLSRDLARALDGQGDRAGAMAVLERSVDKNPDPDTFKFLAQMLAGAQRHADAVAAWERSIESVAHVEDGRIMRGEFAEFLLEGGGGNGEADVVRALGIASRLVEETDRTNPWHLELLGVATQRRGQLEASLAVYREARDRAREVKSASREKLAARVGGRIDELQKQLADR